MTSSVQHSIAILDDYTSSAFSFGGQEAWDALGVPITRFTSAIPPSELVSTLQPFTIICAMRERAAFPAHVIDAVPNLRLIATTGFRNRAIDIAAAQRRGVVVSGTKVKGNKSTSAVEQTWALILALARRVVPEHESVVGGGWQTGVGVGLCGKTLGLVGVGRLGQAVADVGKAFGMRVLGWSPHLDQERADEAGVEFAPSLEFLLKESDVVSLHLVLSDTTKGIISAHELSLLRPTALLVNTSRGPLIDEPALLAALDANSLAGVGLDVFDTEPLPEDAPIRRASNVVLSPHMGYVDDTTYEAMWLQTVENIKAFLEGKPIREMEAEPAAGVH